MSRFVTSDGIALGWEQDGSGTPILCLPGLTRDQRDFDDLAGALGGRYRLIRLTFRGRFGSDWDADFRNYNPGREAEDVVGFLDFLGLDKVTIVGTSRGGLVAMVLGAIAKPRLAGVLLNDIGPEIRPGGLEVIMGYLGLKPKAPTMAALAALLEERMAPSFPNLPPERWAALARRWYREEADGSVGLTYDPKLRDAVIAAGAQPLPDLWPLFDLLADVPLAVVRGANSDLLSRETVAAMQARHPGLIVREVANRGHAPFLNEPEAIAALDALVERVTAASA